MKGETVDFLLLTWAAGALDALAYLRGKAFVANMTGNTVFLGFGVAGGDMLHVERSAIALGGFTAGAVAGVLALNRLTRGRNDWEADAKIGLALELPLLMAFCALWTLLPDPRALLSVGGCAMGIQSMAVRRLRVSGVVTTFITGTITVAILEALHKGPRNPSQRHARATVLAALTFTYALAAAAATALWHAAPPAAPFLSLLAVVAVEVRVWTQLRGA